MIGAILRSMFRALRCAGLVFFALMTIGAFVSIKKPSDVVFTALLAGITLLFLAIKNSRAWQCRRT